MDSNKTYLLNKQIAINGKDVLDSLILKSNEPLKAHEQTLLKIIADNKDTVYGKKYHFADIKSIADFQKLVPIVAYEDIKEYIERMKVGEKNILTAYPFNHFNSTSGTKGDSKFIPFPDNNRELCMKYNNLILYGILYKHLGESYFNGKSFTFVEGKYSRLPSNLTVGSASAIIANAISDENSSLNALISTPVEALQSDNKANRIYIKARFALMDRDLTGFVCSFFNQTVHIFNYIAKYYKVLIEDIRNGTITDEVEISSSVRESLMKKIKPMNDRANELTEAFKDGPDFFAKKVWPNLKYIIGVGGASFSYYDEILKNKYIGKDIAYLYCGISSSEGILSCPIDINNKSSLLALDGIFIEFLPTDANDDFTKIVTIDKLELGKSYELIITNLCGLYRYRIYDVITVTGFKNKTPLVEFAYRANNLVNLSAEKMTEYQLNLAINNAAKELGFEVYDFSVYPNQNRSTPRYSFVVESSTKVPANVNDEVLSKCIGKHLCLVNSLYKSFVENYKTLDAPSAYFVEKGTYDLYREIMILFNKPASQLKPPKVLTNENQIGFFFLFTKHNDQMERLQTLISGIKKLSHNSTDF